MFRSPRGPGRAVGGSGQPVEGAGIGSKREDGGIGRRAGFRFQWGNSRGGSSPPLRTSSESLKNASPAPAQPPAVPVSPRGALAGELARHMARLLAASDPGTRLPYLSP